MVDLVVLCLLSVYEESSEQELNVPYSIVDLLGENSHMHARLKSPVMHVRLT